MRIRRAIGLGLVLLIVGCAANRPAVTRPFPAGTNARETQEKPEQQLHIVTIDISDPRVSLHVVREADPDGDGPWQTTLAHATKLAADHQLDVTVNGDFFAVKERRNIGGRQVPYFAGNWSRVIGMAMSDGRLWSSAKGRVALVVHEDGHITMGKLDQVPPTARQIIGGSHMLLTGGKKTADSKLAAPRTAAGIDRTRRRLVLVVADGRRPGHAVGLTLGELADEMRRLGCVDAVNLDGGGSTALVFREGDTDRYRLMNRPSDGADLPIPLSVERPVANALGVRIARAAATRPR